MGSAVLPLLLPGLLALLPKHTLKEQPTGTTSHMKEIRTTCHLLTYSTRCLLPYRQQH